MYIEFTCVYERILAVSMTESESISAFFSTFRVEMEEGKGLYDVKIGLFTDVTLKTLAPDEYKIQVPQVLYIGSFLKTTDINLVLLFGLGSKFFILDS